MGQDANGLLYGVRCDAVRPGLPGEYQTARRAAPDVDGSCTVVGFWVAVRNGDDRRIPDLAVPVALDQVGMTKPYAASLRRATKQWDAFAKWAAERESVFPPARLWLVMTEVG